MPIVDPSLQCFFIKSIEKTKNDGYAFILKYLQIASRNLNRNSSTIEASIQFKKDFTKSISIINEIFGCNFTSFKNLGDTFQKNCYKYFYHHINVENKKMESKKYKGKFKICNDKFSTRIFQPYVFYSKYHSWFFTDTPIAILSINSDNFAPLDKNEKKQLEILKFIKLEIDLISASGLTLVLCFNYSPVSINLLTQIIKDNQFSEIHCNIFNDLNLKSFLISYQKNFQSDSHFLKGYFYLYCHYAEKQTEEQKLLKEFKKKPHVRVITFSKSPENSFLKIDFNQIKPFLHCKNGFECKYLRIFLSYVPLYESENDKESFIPSNISNLCLGYISPKNFLKMDINRIEILFDDEMDLHHHTFKYINFDDIHSIKSEFFVEDAFYLTKIDENEIQTINKIKTKVDFKIANKANFHRKYLLGLLNNKKFMECLQYVTFAYSHTIRSSIVDFAIHRNQIYAAFEACKSFFTVVKGKNPDDKKGIIYQVETGEGKSCIVCLIAAVLAIKKYTVHIASSNIKLSNRDYYNSFDFFKILGLKSAVLLHKNELPFKNIDPNINKNEEEEEIQQSEIPHNELNKNEYDNFFKNNADNYYEVNTKKGNEAHKKSYPDEFFGDDLFKNPSGMNFSVCGIDNDNKITKRDKKANIIFSTFVNFECFYLYLMEMCPGYIDVYFKKCGLLIDEADSILIDEIANGTIVSREVKSHAKEVLSYVLYHKNKNENKKTAEEVYHNLKNNEMCSDIKLKDVIRMYKEIDTVFNDEFKNGRKYSVETFYVKNNFRIKNLMKKTFHNIINIPDRFADFIDKKLQGDDDDDDMDDEDEEFDTSVYKQFKQIVPFDYNHKGILEPNKEFGGFIHQFIAIKESMENVDLDLIFKDISMNYMYISHPIFIGLYPKICGFTGTIGNADDKKIYNDYYKLITKKVPRNKTNLRVNFPMIICDNIKERNEKIVSEVIHFHDKNIPVLVIFQDLNEIETIQNMLFEQNIKCINTFKGKDEFLLPDQIAGIKGAISLGTNVCGRGTDIRVTNYPLHVIVSFYSSNPRVMNQAYGRTARQGNKGTCRCICTKEQYLNKKIVANIEKTKQQVGLFEYKISAQKEFIEFYKKERPWIFEFNIKNQKISEKDIKNLRKIRININRIVAYNYRYPICMSVNTFLKIQAQKIFSLFNCPNCKYTWRLFQRHIREMILESWSIMIKKIDEDYINIKKQVNYQEILEKQIKKLHKKLKKYIPQRHFDIVDTFMHIYRIVRHQYQSTVLNSFGNISNAYLSFGETKFTLFQLGFKPFSLLNRSGAQIKYGNIDETNYIEDPELSYLKKMPDNTFSFVSITERIDNIFNYIFQKISSTLGEKVYLKFFLRRTLAGCEFGICFDINLINKDDQLKEKKYFLVDKDPLLVFTIFLWSMAPLMAGILIFALVYVTGLVKKLITWIGCFPEKISEEVIKQGIIASINLIVPKAADFFLERIINYLENVLDKQIEKLVGNSKKIVELLKIIFLQKDFENTGKFISEKISSILGGVIKIPEKLGSILKDSINVALLMKIGFLLLLCLGTYIIIFKTKKEAIKYAETSAESYNSIYEKETKEENKNIKTENQTITKNLDNIIENEKTDIELNEVPKLDQESFNFFKDSFEKVLHTYIYKFKTLNLSKYELSTKDFININDKKFGYYIIFYMTHKTTGKRYLNLQFNKDFNFEEKIRLYGTTDHPAISKFFGYSIKLNTLNTFVEDKENDFLNNIPYSLNSTNILIIAYGLAAALEFLHSRQIVLRDFRPKNIQLDSHLYPYLFDFYSAVNLESDVDENPPNSMISFLKAPELIENPEKYSKTFPIDVFAYGMNLYNIMFDDNYLLSICTSRVLYDIVNGKRPNFPFSAKSQWKNLIERCWHQEPDKRPTFTEICDLLESPNFDKKDIDIKAFNDYVNIIKPYRPNKIEYKQEIRKE